MDFIENTYKYMDSKEHYDGMVASQFTRIHAELLREYKEMKPFSYSLDQINKENKALYSNFLLFVFIVLVLLSILISVIFKFPNLNIILLGIIVAITMLAVAYGYNVRKNKIIGDNINSKSKEEIYAMEYEDKVIKPLIKISFPQAIYGFKDGLTHHDYLYAKYFLSEIFDSSNNMILPIDNMHTLNMSYIVSEYFSYRRYHGEERRTDFRGLFGMINIKNQDNYILYIKVNNKSKFSGEFNKSATLGKNMCITKDERENLKKVSIKNKEFYKKFFVYSNDVEKTKEILSEEIMEVLLKLYSIRDNYFDIKIKSNNLYLRQETSYFLGTPNVSIDPFDKDILIKCYKSIFFMGQLSKVLLDNLKFLN